MSDFDLSEWISEGSSATPVGKEIEPRLSPNAVKLLNYCEQVFWECGTLPTPEACSEELSIDRHTVGKWFRDETFRNQVAARGMDCEGLITVGKVIAQSKVLSPRQILCANLMLNLHDKRSEREKLKELGISPQQYSAWLRQPQFVEFLRKRGEALFSASDFEAYKSLVRNVKAGDNKALEMFFQMRGIWRKSVDVNVNIESVLVQVVEIVSKHVSPQVMQAIAGELEAVLEEAEEVA